MVQITCIKKDGGRHDNPYEAITELGWKEVGGTDIGRISRVGMFNWINKGGQAFVQDAFGNRAFLMTAVSPSGTQFVKTVADNTRTDNLLSLMECVG